MRLEGCMVETGEALKRGSVHQGGEGWIKVSRERAGG